MAEENEQDKRPEDPRLARLRKMQSSYVTEQTLEDAVPKPPPPPPPPEEEPFDDEEFLDEEYLEDEDYPDDEDYPEEDYPDDEADEQGQKAVAPPPPPPAPSEPEPEPEPEPEDKDVRMARLRKLQGKIVHKNELDTNVQLEVEEIDEDEEKTVPCTFCGKDVSFRARACDHCGAKMPKMSEMSGTAKHAPGTLEQSPLYEIRDLIQEFRENLVTAEEVADFLWDKLEALRIKSMGMLEFAETSGDAERYPDNHARLELGLQEFEGAIELMATDLEDGYYDELEQSLDMMEHGQNLLLQYMGRNEDIAKELNQEMHMQG